MTYSTQDNPVPRNKVLPQRQIPVSRGESLLEWVTLGALQGLSQAEGISQV